MKKKCFLESLSRYDNSISHNIMERNMKLKKIRKLLSIILFLVIFSNPLLHLHAQEKTPDNITQKFFMPALQMGYINHNSDNISAGLLIQTSLEFRTKRNLLFRINYDDFSGRVDLKMDNNQTYNARIPISELLGGVGYRLNQKRHNYFLIAQTGIRFYENPIIEHKNGVLNIEQKGTTIGTARYTLGYEYEVFERIFLNLECFTGNFFKTKDFWNARKPYFGITLGMTAALF